MSLRNKIIVVSGGASGMGAVTVEHLARLGAKVAVLDLDAEKSGAIVERTQALAITCDVCSEPSVAKAVDTVEQHWGVPNAVINCAGIAPAARILGKAGVLPLQDFRRVIEVNLIGTFNVLRLVAARMKQQPADEQGERGVIINTASIAAYEGQIGQAAYSASKGGVVSLTLPAARELGEWGIRVVTIAPGIMDTPMMGAMPDAVRQELMARVPFPKRLGNSQEYAYLVETILMNRYLNACVIRLDGGLRLPSK